MNVKNEMADRRQFLKATTGIVCGGLVNWLDFPPTMSNLPKNEELVIIKKRLVSLYGKSALVANNISESDLLNILDATGEWTDLKTRFKAEQAGIQRYAHFTRVLKLAGVYRQVAATAEKIRIKEALHRAMSVWLGKPHPASAGWFYQIGVPLALGQAAILFEEELSPTERQNIIVILKTCVLPDGTLDYSGSPATGENLMHEAIIQILAGCLAEDFDYVMRHIKLIEREIGPGRPESIQKDLSFHQHGPQFYSGGLYGRGFAREGSMLIQALRQTAFSLASDKVETLVRYVLDGIQPLVRGQYFDFTTVGRLVAWPQMEEPDFESKIKFSEVCHHLIPFAGKRKSELTEFAERLNGKSASTTAPKNNTLFWCSDYMAHNRRGFHASARMSSRRVHSHESGGLQNELGYHLGDGSMCLMRTGKEYHDIFPLWDWRRIPGVSCVYNPSEPFPKHNWGNGSNGGSDFAGGVTDGVSGAAAMELNRGGMRAKKAWFFIDDVIVCLGTGLKADNPSLPVVTSINQTWLNGSVTSSEPIHFPPSGEANLSSFSGWIHHDGIAYIFPKDTSIRISKQQKKASWDLLNRAPHRDARLAPNQSHPQIEGDVFSIWIAHGLTDTQTGNYCYLIAPDLHPEAISDFMKKNQSPVIVSNTIETQAVVFKNFKQCVFWQSGKITLPDSSIIEADQPCIVQWKQVALSKWTLAVGNPTHKVGLLTVSVYDKAAAAMPIQIKFDFPDNAFVGRPQIRSFSKPK